MSEKNSQRAQSEVWSPGSGDMERPSGSSSKELTRYADSAMFTAEPIDGDAGPRVYLLSMTPAPLAAIAAACKMYKGEVARSYRDVTHEERQEFIVQVLKTKLQAPFEFVKFHFMIEGVTRAFTHQMVRQRTAVYAQESLRFAVKEDMPVALPPSLAGTTGVWRQHEAELMELSDAEDASDALVQVPLADRMVRESEEERQRWAWDMAIDGISSKYQYLVNSGVPAEDARGLLPHNTLTRLHYSTDLRALLDHAGNRLCTQAQFEWRLVFAKIAEAIRNYKPYETLANQLLNLGENDAASAVAHCARSDHWQYELLADLFRPVCYATGKCEFMADFDRHCDIRGRVQANHAIGRESSKWAEPHTSCVASADCEDPNCHERVTDIPEIRPAEWLLNPGAAR